MDSPIDDSIGETPVKQRYTVDLVSDDENDLVPRDLNPQSTPSSNADAHITQPTQIIDRGVPDTPARSTVQVPASSPIAARLHSGVGSVVQSPPRNAQLQSSLSLNHNAFTSPTSFAPPGTVLRLPPGATNSLKTGASVKSSLDSSAHIDLTQDEGMRYQGSYSDVEDNQSRDIKPSVVKQRKKDGPAFSFNDVLSRAKYTGPLYISQNEGSYGKAKTTSDLMASAYGGRDRIPTRPEKAVSKSVKQTQSPVTSLDQISDMGVREKARRVLDILPDKTIQDVLRALMDKRGNVDDAMDLLVENDPETKEVDLTKSSDDDTISEEEASKPRAKQELKVAAISVLDKYGVTKKQQSSRAPNVQSSRKRPAEDEVEVEQPRRKKLVRGDQIQSKKLVQVDQIPSRKLVRGDQISSKKKVVPEVVSINSDSDSEDSDSGIATHESEEVVVIDNDLLKIFNESKIEELMDLANTKRETTEIIIAQRPFRSFDAIKKVRQPGAKPFTGRGKPPPTLGEKVLEYADRMYEAFKCIDILVRQCREMRKTIITGIESWGVNVVGLTKEGEFNLLTLHDSENLDIANNSAYWDSGLGTPATIDEHGESDNQFTSSSKLVGPPKSMAQGIKLKDYQIIGMNWMAFLFSHRFSCILADEMGLGKTCQVIALLAHLQETGITGPHVVIVPSSVFDNWLREFEKFCPSLTVLGIEGNQKERRILQDKILEDDPYVVLTTYSFAKQQEDRKFLASLRPVSCIFDEGHALTHPESAQYQQLMKINPEWRLVLTGTPLQNNLAELTALLGFLMPDLFREHQEDLQAIFEHKAKTTDTDHTALLSAERTARARSMMAPFILRRKKHQVEELPEKTCRVEYCELEDRQKHIYDDLLSKYQAAKKLQKEAPKDKQAAKIRTETLMKLRKAAIHPLLMRVLFDDKRINDLAEMLYKMAPPANYPKQHYKEDLKINYDFQIHQALLFEETPAAVRKKFALREHDWMDAGKVKALVSLLRTYKENGDRALVFSQFKMALDILEAVFETEGVTFCRIDGDTGRNDRQLIIDMYTDNPNITAFLMTTKAGGMGLNIAAANKVVIFDMSFNPFVDLQAENRAHRIGQTRPVEVVRLVSKGTIEEHIAALGAAKLQLDERVAGEDAGAEKVEKEGMKRVEEMMEATGA